MKKILFMPAVFCIAFSGMAQQKKMKDLVGHWEVFGDKGNNATLEVIDSSTILLTYNGEKKKITDYKIDFAKSPIWFDFSTEGDNESIAVKSIIEIVNESMIKWQLFVDEERTPYFSSSKGELFYLRKTRSPIATTSVVSN